MECVKCGNCCRYMLVTPKVKVNGDADWFEAHGVSIQDGMLKISIPCYYLLPDGSCKIHDRRPNACRRAKVGSIPECEGRNYG